MIYNDEDGVFATPSIMEIRDIPHLSPVQAVPDLKVLLMTP
jgi:hypothetical protein